MNTLWLMFEIQVLFYCPERKGENSHICIYIYIYAFHLLVLLTIYELWYFTQWSDGLEGYDSISNRDRIYLSVAVSRSMIGSIKLLGKGYQGLYMYC